MNLIQQNHYTISLSLTYKDLRSISLIQQPFDQLKQKDLITESKTIPTCF